MQLSVEEILKITKGELLAGSPGGYVHGALIDSREARGGELFFPLQGERVNGHRFIHDALKRGAAASLLEKKYLHLFSAGEFTGDKAVIIVDDCLRCLQAVAASYRGKFSLSVVGITGSNGKTTTKDLIASVLATRYCVLKTEGNYNNHIGLPLTLLRLEARHQIAVLEMGMRGPGEIATLAALAKPCLGVITNIGEAHLELLGSRENISKAKGELLEAMGAGGTAVLNGDDPFLKKMGTKFPGRTVFFGYGEGLDLQAKHSRLEGEGYAFTALLPRGEMANFWVPLPGKHNVYNALAAVATGLQFSLEVPELRAGLANASCSGMRMERLQTKSGFWLINDAYNASPSSMLFALETLKEWAGNGTTIAVLGDMLELGAYMEEGHRRAGFCVARTGIDYLLTVGPRGELIGRGAKEAGFPPRSIFTCSSNAEALEVLQSLPLVGAHVLVKGSRAMGMEMIVKELLAKYN